MTSSSEPGPLCTQELHTKKSRAEEISKTSDSSAKESGETDSDPRGSDFAHLFVFANEKAGMTKVDKDRVNQVVFEMSKGSEHFREAQRRDERTQIEVRKLREKLSRMLESDLAPVRYRVDERVGKLLQERDLTRIYCVVDMDCFFAAVEMRDDPSLARKPMAVGGMSMISTTNYLAREYGVRSAMPGFIAKKLCPDLVFVKSNFDKYRQASAEVREVFKEYDPDHHAGSLDEAYMDITDYVDDRLSETDKRDQAKRMEYAAKVVHEMRQKVADRTKLTCSAGIACTTMLAKIGSDRNKPNGQCVIPWEPKKMLDFVRELAIRKVPGIGKVTEKKLKDALDINSVQDLWEKRYLCAYLLSKIQADYLLRVTLCCTESSSRRDEPRGRQSMGMERTFSVGTSSPQELFDTCQDICGKLANRCVEKKIYGYCVTLKIKKSSFEVFTRQKMLPNAVPRLADGSDLFPHAHELLSKEMPCKLRLMGIKISKLSAAGPQSCSTNQVATKTLQGSIMQSFQAAKERHSRPDSPSANSATPMQCPLCEQTLDGLSPLEANKHAEDCLTGCSYRSNEPTFESVTSNKGQPKITTVLKNASKKREYEEASQQGHGKTILTTPLESKKKRSNSAKLQSFWKANLGTQRDRSQHYPNASSRAHTDADAVIVIQADDNNCTESTKDNEIEEVEEIEIVEPHAGCPDRQGPRCPACGKLFDVSCSNNEVNQHLDACLMK